MAAVKVNAQKAARLRSRTVENYSTVGAKYVEDPFEPIDLCPCDASKKDRYAMAPKLASALKLTRWWSELEV